MRARTIIQYIDKALLHSIRYYRVPSTLEMLPLSVSSQAACFGQTLRQQSRYWFTAPA